MKGAILSIISASTVAAQLSVAPEVFGVAAVNINDPEYTTCSAVAEYVAECVTAVGGSDALATADPSSLLACACCISETPVYPLYSACSSYLSDEGGATYSDSYSAYSVLYSACNAAEICSQGDNSFPTSTTESAESFPTSTITSAGSAEQTYATACEDMIGIFTSCTNKIDGFTELPFKEQASCYCCRTRGGTLSWTDAIDQYASSCADWAITGESKTAYSVAKTFATFCERFSDVCDNAVATDSETTATVSDVMATDSSSTGNPLTEPVTVTIQPTETGSSGSKDNGAGSLRVGSCGVILAAVLAVVIAM